MKQRIGRADEVPFPIRFGARLTSLIQAVTVLMSFSVRCMAQEFISSNINSLVRSIEENIDQAKGKKAPALEFTNIETNVHQHLTDYLGRTLLLKFGFRGCKGCEEDMRVVSKLQDDYDDRGFVAIYICVGSMEDANRYFDARMLDGNPIHGVKVLVDRDSLLPPFQAFVAPMTIVVDRGGVIRGGWLKPANYEKFESSVLPFLPQAPVKWQRAVILVLVTTGLLMLFINRVRLRKLRKR